MEQIEKYFIYDTDEQLIVYNYEGFDSLSNIQVILSNCSPNELKNLVVCTLTPYATVVPPEKSITLNILTNEPPRTPRQSSEENFDWREFMRTKYNIPSRADIHTSTFWMYRDFPEAEVIYSVHTPGGYLDRECWNYYNEKHELLKSETGGYC